MPGQLNGKRILVTGASRGAGKSIARACAADGGDVVIHYNAQRDSAEALAQELGDRALGVIGKDLGEAGAGAALWAEAEAQFAAEMAATNAAQLAAARAQLDGSSGISVAGHPKGDFNGLYTHDSTHEGWPVLKNAKGRYCYRYKATDSWRLSDKARHDEDASMAKIVAKEGPLPVGAHTWQVASRGEWVDGTLTVGLLVRTSPALRASSCSA